MVVIPAKLKKGDRVALLGGSGPNFDFTAEQMEEKVRELGLEPVLYPSATARHGYLAGKDAQRAEDIMAAFTDPSIQGILTIRGGYGFARVLPLLDFDVIRENPKFFMGYSDVTAMHIAMNQKAETATWHCPMVVEWLRGLDEYTMDHVKKALFEEGADFSDPAEYPARKTLVSGCAEGMLCGGNLTLLSQSLGTPYEIDTKDKILFIEETDEPFWKIDGMLNQLRNAGKLADAKGIVLGSWNNCGTDADVEKSLVLEQVFEELIVPLGVPAMSGIACGHAKPTMTLPMGQKVRMNADTCEIELC